MNHDDTQHIDELNKILLDRHLTISTAESITCGNIQRIIGQPSGASAYFLGGVTAYDIDQKVNILKVDRDDAQKVNCVSRNITEQMAIGVRALFNSDVSIATTGYIEPNEKLKIDQPQAHIVANVNGNLFYKWYMFDDGDRINMQEEIGYIAIEFLIECVTKHIKLVPLINSNI